MKILHLGLCVNPHGFSSFPHAFKKVLGESNYRELQCSPDSSFNPNAIAIFNEFKPDLVFMQIQAENIIQQNKYTSDIAIQNAQISLESIKAAYLSLLEAKKAAGSVYSQIGSSALNAINVSAQVQGSANISLSESHDYKY